MSQHESQPVFTSTSPEATHELGQRLGRSLVGGLVTGLVGPLGAGKTQLIKGVAVGNALADDRAVTSPTFTLIHEYTGRLTLYHLDAYRLNSATDLLALGFDELQRRDSVVMVEWADRVRAAMPEESLWLTLECSDPTVRTIKATARGDAAHAVLDAWERDIR